MSAIAMNRPRLALCMIVALLGAPAAAQAQTSLAQTSSAQTSADSWPDRAVRIVVPTAAGGSIDTTARIIGEKLQARWGKPVVIENKAGAAMRIGADYVAKSTPDGYTLLVAHDGTMAMNAVIYKSLPYDPVKDFAPLALIASIPEVIMVNARSPAKSFGELLDLAKRQPGVLNHGTGGTATLLALELLKAMAGVDIKSVPYRGGAPAVSGLINGDVDVVIADVVTGGPALQSPQARPLAVTTLNRQKKFPALPSMNEAGVAGYDVKTWIGAFAPANTPGPVLDKIEADIAATMKLPDVRARFESIGMEIGRGGNAEMRATLAADIEKWGRLVREKNIQIDQN